jgi:L-amino acid N-acyltransferase YncA
VSRRQCYAGVAEVSLYVGADARGQGVGRALLLALIHASEEHRIWTLQGATFAENVASLRLQADCGFRVVGRRERIAMLNGVWRDTILTERRSSCVGTSYDAAGRPTCHKMRVAVRFDLCYNGPKPIGSRACSGT